MESKTLTLEPSLEKQLKGHRNSVTALFFSPNEHQLASSSLDNSVLLWDLRGTIRSYRFQGHDEAVMDVTFSPTGKYMASASRDKTVRLWVPTVTGSTGIFKAHSQTVRSVQFSPDGSKIITASDDKIIKIWSSEKHKFICSLVGHTNWVRCARISNDGSVIASCSDDKTTRLWSPDTGECVHVYKDQKGHGLYVAWHPSGCYIAVATSQGNVKLYDVRTHNLVQYYSIHNNAVTQVAFHPSGSYILTSSQDGKMKVLDLLEGHPIFTLSGHEGSINTVHFSPSGDYFASAGEDKMVSIWKTNFTELAPDVKENMDNNSIARSTSQASGIKHKSQDVKLWYLCYHSAAYPVTTFVHLDDINEAVEQTFEEPIANSTKVDLTNGEPRSQLPHFERYPKDPSIHMGDTSHIPRTPPTPATYSIPSLIDNTGYNNYSNTINNTRVANNIFGMIKLKENDVCYTSGTIEWVGKKRSYPINTGFKTIDETFKRNEPNAKKTKVSNINTTFLEEHQYCDCADVLPTVNAIVEHLNALHDAVDLVDIRLNTLEDSLTRH